MPRRRRARALASTFENDYPLVDVIDSFLKEKKYVYKKKTNRHIII